MQRRFKTALKTAIFIVIMAGFSYLWASTSANAQTGNGFVISPTVVELEADPGETVSGVVTVKNITSDTLQAAAEINNFGADGEDGSPKIVVDEDAESTDHSLKEYVQPIEDFILEPDESKEVEVFIKVPFNATPGGHYGVARFTAQTPESNDTVNLSASVGTLILVNVSGDTVENLELLETGVTKNGNSRLVYSSSPDKFFARVQNNGNTHSKPFGILTFSNMFGSEVERLEFNKVRGNALPDSVRRFEENLSDNYSFGRYTYEGSLSYGNGSELINVAGSFWVIPVWLLIVLLVFTLAIIGIFITFRTIRGNRIVMVPRKRRKSKSKN